MDVFNKVASLVQEFPARRVALPGVMASSFLLAHFALSVCVTFETRQLTMNEGWGFLRSFGDS